MLVRLDASFLQVGGSLLMRSDGETKASFTDVNLFGEKSPAWSTWQAQVSAAI